MIRIYSLLIAFFLLASSKAERIANHYEIQDLGKKRSLDGKIQIEFEVFDDYNEICNKDVSFYLNKELLKADCNDSICTLFTDSIHFKCRIQKRNTYPVYISEELKKSHQYKIKVYLQGRRENVRKPVIYIHTKDTLPLKIRLTTACENIFSYPPLSAQNEWEMISYPDQSISFQGENYRYLFWDGELASKSFAGFLTNASTVRKDSLLPFLESTLKSFGFNSKEKADFITYWYPLMQQFNGVQVEFLFNEEVHELAKLDNNQSLPVYQLYMIWAPIHSTTEIESNYSDKIIPQISTPNNYILEWGGVQLNQNTFEYENEF